MIIIKNFDITGMSCAACSSAIEKTVSKIDGVSSCSVNLLSNSMSVDTSIDDEIIINAVEKLGYGASVKGDTPKTDTPKTNTKKRFVISLILLLMLMYFSMGHMMFSLPIPHFYNNNPTAIGLTQLLLNIAIIFANQKFFKSGFSSLLHKAPNMDTLVALGSSAALVYSIYSLFLVSATQDASLLCEFYFEASAMILVLITLGKMLEENSKSKTTNALNSLINLMPKMATIIRDGKEVQISADKIQKGDIFVVRAGDIIPADGTITQGSGSIDESSMTGESIPIDKTVKSTVAMATSCKSGYIQCIATSVGEDTLFSQIIKAVSDSSATKPPIARIADKVSGIFVPVVITISIITAIVWLILGQSVGFSLARAISVLVISCPCALGLATPVAITVANGIGAKNGILFKNAEAIETAGKINIAVFDKTGTITIGKPYVTDIVPINDICELIKVAFSLEKKSEHPLAKAIIDESHKRNIDFYEVEGFETFPGGGIKATNENVTFIGGNLKFIEQYANVPKEIISSAENKSSEGKTILYFAKDSVLLGYFAVADVIKPDSKEAVSQLHDMGIKVIMLTGDNEKAANAIGKLAGVDKVIANVLPTEKENEIKKLKSLGSVAMVGDGINDAPALVSADIGIAIGSGADTALDASEIVLMKSSLLDVPAVIRLSRATIRNIRQNLFWAFFYNSVGIPIAAGVLINAFGIKLSPMLGAAAMSLSSFCVVSNALRLNRVKLYKNQEKGKINIMKKTIKIEGMMCAHCEARVKKCIEGVDGVVSADVSHVTGIADITLSKDIPDGVIEGIIENEGYKVVE